MKNLTGPLNCNSTDNVKRDDIKASIETSSENWEKEQQEDGWEDDFEWDEKNSALNRVEKFKHSFPL